MSIKERRKNIRVDSLNLLEVSVIENQNVIYQGFGRTLNISESGILLETHFAVDLTNSLSLALAIENDLINVNGKAVYCKPGKERLFEIGVQFVDIDDIDLKVIKKLVRAFSEEKE